MSTTLTAADILQMSRKQLVKLDAGIIRAIYADQDTSKLAAFNKVLNSAEGQAALAELVSEVSAPITPAEQQRFEAPKTADQLASEAEALATAEREAQAKFDREAAEKTVRDAQEAEVAALAAAGITVQKDAQGNIVKITKRYQATDENSQPIGHPTHLEARNWPELSLKQQAAHENAMRLAERIKKQKVTFKQPEPALDGLLSEDQIRQMLREVQTEKDPSKLADLHQKISTDEQLRFQLEKAAVKEQHVTLKWMRKHIHDFVPNQANSLLLDGYLKDNNLEYSDDNLEVAFIALQPQLAEATAAIPVNTTLAQPAAVPAAPAAPVAPAVPAPAAASQPSVAAPATPVTGNQPAPARRPGVNGGIPPGSFSGTRPGAASQASQFTMKDLKELSKNPKELRRRMTMEPGFTEKVNALLRSRQS